MLNFGHLCVHICEFTCPCGSYVEYRSAESEGLGSISPWTDTFTLSQARVKTNDIFPYIMTKLEIELLSYSKRKPAFTL